MTALDDGAALARLKDRSVSLLADVLDQVGLHDQVLAPGTRRLDGSRWFAGVARTIEYELLPAERRFGPFNPDVVLEWLRHLEASLHDGDVLVVGFAGEIATCAILGEFLGTLAARQGVQGLVTDGYARDLDRLVQMGLGVAAAGTSALTARGRLKRRSFDGTVTVAGVKVQAGDLVVSDGDGTIVIPRDLAASDRFAETLADLDARERGTAEMLEAGRRFSEAFERHRSL